MKRLTAVQSVAPEAEDTGLPWLRTWKSVYLVVIIFFVLWDVFEVIVLPRRVSRRIRLTILIYLLTWRPYASIARRMQSPGVRATSLSPVASNR